MNNFKEMIGKKRGYTTSTDSEIIKSIDQNGVDLGVRPCYYIEYESGLVEGPMPDYQVEHIRDYQLLKKFKCYDIVVETFDEDYAWELIFDIRCKQLHLRNKVDLLEATILTIRELDNLEDLGWS